MSVHQAGGHVVTDILHWQLCYRQLNGSSPAVAPPVDWSILSYTHTLTNTDMIQCPTQTHMIDPSLS